jgi:hypothetical protein
LRVIHEVAVEVPPHLEVKFVEQFVFGLEVGKERAFGNPGGCRNCRRRRICDATLRYNAQRCIKDRFPLVFTLWPGQWGKSERSS